MTSLTLNQAWRIRAAVGGIAALDRQPVAGDHRRSAIAVAARRASNEAGISLLAATQATPPCAPRGANAHTALALAAACPLTCPRV